MTDQVTAGRPLAQLMEWFPDLHNGEPGSLVARCPMVHDGDIEGVVRVVETAADSGLWSGGCDLGCTWAALEELGLFARRVPGEDDDARPTQQPLKERNVFLRNHRQLTVDELEADPPPFQFILEPYIPSNCVSVLTGPGGSNKTTFLLYLAVCRALGRAMFKGMKVPEEGETIIVTCEDRVADYQRKLAAFRIFLGTEWNSKAIAERLHFFDLSGELVRFIAAERGEQFRPTALVEEFVHAIKRKAPKASYVTVETISRVTGGVENNPAMAALVGAGEQICRQAEVTLTYVGHVSQDAARSGRIDAYTARGGSALGDSGRSSIGMAPLLEDKREVYARGLDITADALERTLVLAHTKTNGVAAAKPVLLYRESTRWGPILVEPAFESSDEPQEKGKKVPGRKANRTYDQTRKAVIEYVTAKQPTAGNAVAQDLGGTRGHILTVIADLIKEQILGRDEGGRLVVRNTSSESKSNSNQKPAEPPVRNPLPSLSLQREGRMGDSEPDGFGSSASVPANRTVPKDKGPF